MLKAWQHHKIDRGTRSALQGSEDVLTSTVMGRLGYLPAALQWAVLVGAEPEPLAGSQPWPKAQPAGAPTWELWPSLPPPEGDGGRRVEPDVVLAWGPWLVIFEAKHRGEQHADQWARQARALLAAREHSADRLLHVALGGWRPARDQGRAAWFRDQADLSAVPLYRLGWRALNGSLSRSRPPDLDPGLAALIEDAQAFLDAAGHHHERGLWTLPRAHRAIGPLPSTLPSLPLLGADG